MVNRGFQSCIKPACSQILAPNWKSLCKFSLRKRKQADRASSLLRSKDYGRESLASCNRRVSNEVQVLLQQDLEAQLKEYPAFIVASRQQADCVDNSRKSLLWVFPLMAPCGVTLPNPGARVGAWSLSAPRAASQPFINQGFAKVNALLTGLKQQHAKVVI